MVLVILTLAPQQLQERSEVRRDRDGEVGVPHLVRTCGFPAGTTRPSPCGRARRRRAGDAASTHGRNTANRRRRRSGPSCRGDGVPNTRGWHQLHPREEVPASWPLPVDGLQHAPIDPAVLPRKLPRRPNRRLQFGFFINQREEPAEAICLPVLCREILLTGDSAVVFLSVAEVRGIELVASEHESVHSPSSSSQNSSQN